MYLIPKPHEWKCGQGAYVLYYAGRISLEASCSQEDYEVARLLKQEILEDTGFDYQIVPGLGTAEIVLERGGLADKGNRSEQKCKEGQVADGEAYQLMICENGVKICGAGKRGLLYGVQTLRQILRQEGAVLPYMEISDAPDISVRGFYHDATRGRVPTLAWLKKLADTLGLYKINQMQLYVEHSYLFEQLSEMWRDDTPLTAEDIIELDQYCAKRGIELVPSLSTFGHLYKLLRTKQYRHLCELENPDAAPFGFRDRMMHHTINVSDPDGMTLIKSMLREYMALFTTRKFNLCADETFDLGAGKNAGRLTDEGEGALYISYVGDLCRFLADEGRTPMIWGDRLIAFPELAAMLPKETICLNWGYAPDETEDHTRTYAQTGIRQYVCPGVSGWNHLMNRQEDGWKNISRMCSYADKYGAEGVLNTDWGDYGHVNHPTFSIPGMIYGAAASWNREQLPYEELNRQISVLEYRDSSGKFLELTDLLSKQESFDWYTFVNFKERMEAESTGEAGDISRFHSEEYLKHMEVLTEEVLHRAAEAAEKNDRMREIVSELAACIRNMDSSTRGSVKPYLLAAEGMQIMNRIGWVIAEAAGGTIHSKEAWELAEALEKWYYQYRILWHTVSRESELYRIGEVIFWYADYLREF